MIPYTLIFILLCVGVFWYRAFEMDQRSGIVGATLGIGVWLISPDGYLWHIVGQLLLFFGIALYRVWREKPKA